MKKATDPRRPVRVHMTNITGLGAVQLLKSLLPSLERSPSHVLKVAYLPSIGELANYKLRDTSTRVIYYKRFLPNAISRIVECIVPFRIFSGDEPLLVMGDVPLPNRANQTVFVQSPLLTRSASSGRRLGAIKYWIARRLFQRNIKNASAFIVQTEAMRTALIDTYPEICNRVYVIPQPAPNWLLESGLKRTARLGKPNEALRLFYPAAVYPHKNHRLLSKISPLDLEKWPVSDLILSIPDEINPNPALPWIQCIDRLDADGMLSTYATVDALLFLSLSESFGFPLVEAMWIGLPIICADRPYAHALCGEEAIYFNPDDPHSLNCAIVHLHLKLTAGWWPDWSEQLEAIPRDWSEVAAKMLAVASGDGAGNREVIS